MDNSRPSSVILPSVAGGSSSGRDAVIDLIAGTAGGYLYYIDLL